MNESPPLPDLPPAIRVPAGEDRFGEHRGLGISVIEFKVVPQDSSGFFIIENSFHAPGGPPRHLHYEQDEWFYAVEGEFLIEVGQERIRLNPGDSLLAPRRVPHVWAYVGEAPGKILIGFQPAGKMETFFQEAAKISDFAADEKLYRACEMEIVGPPISLG